MNLLWSVNVRTLNIQSIVTGNARRAVLFSVKHHNSSSVDRNLMVMDGFQFVPMSLMSGTGWPWDSLQWQIGSWWSVRPNAAPDPNADVEMRGSTHCPEGYWSPALLPHFRLGSSGPTLDSPMLKRMRGGGWMWISKQPPDYLPVSWGSHWWIKSCFPAPLGLGPGHAPPRTGHSALGKGAGVLCGTFITIVILHLGVWCLIQAGDVESTALLLSGVQSTSIQEETQGLTQDKLLFWLAGKLSGNPAEELVEAARERSKSGQMVTRQDETIFRVPICVCVFLWTNSLHMSVLPHFPPWSHCSVSTSVRNCPSNKTRLFTKVIWPFFFGKYT